jgi:hypothetical protein
VVETAVRRRVVAVWLLLAALVAIVIVVEYRDVVASRSGRTGAADARMLLPLPVEQLGAIEIALSGTLHRFERDAGGAWFYHGAHAASERDHTHTPDPAMAERIERAVLAFGRARIERQLDRGDGKTFGVTAPAMVVLVYRPKAPQPLVQYAVGDVAPDTVSRYVDVVGGPGVVTIPNYQIENLVSLVDAATRPTGRP